VFEIVDSGEDMTSLLENLQEKNLKIAETMKEQKLGIASFYMRAGQPVGKAPQQEEAQE